MFDDSVDTYFRRQLVNERIQEVRTRLPETSNYARAGGPALAKSTIHAGKQDTFTHDLKTSTSGR
jgi:Cu/Ag efflux pump CusA